MNESHRDTEKVILDAARKVFLQHGFEGTTTQMIADVAGINKALLHYYYRNKDKLFEAVFMEAFMKMIPNIGQVLSSDMDLFKKIEKFVEIYIDSLINYPQIPLFILHELHRNPSRVVELISSTELKPRFLLAQFEEEIRKGTIIRMDPNQIVVNMMAMCIFPFAARPIVQGFIFGNDREEYQEFLESRKTEVARFIIQAIRKQ